MRIAVIGVNHNDASVEIREKVAFCETKKIETVNTLLDLGISETIILSTCNRSEIYIVSKDLDKHIEETKNFYKEFFQVEDIENYLFVKKDHEAILHIYNVAAGLDSIVIGEDQILGQVKEALQSAMEVGCSKKILNKLFREAVTAAKQIKSTLGISEIPLSTSYIAIKNLKEELGTLKNKNILVIGAGKISSLALKYFEEEEVGTVYMTNRTMHKIEDICTECKKLHIEAIDFKERYKIIKNVDVVFTATSATHLILKKDMMPEIDHELHIIDLAVPRDVEISIKENKLIKVYDIDDLKKLSDENLKKREILSENASGIIENSIKDFYEWMKGIKFDPVIKSLNERCREIEEDTFDYINRKLELDCREKKIIEKMIKSSLKRLIREPINNLKDLNKEENVEQYIEMMNKLFNF
ncbi:glutamyl-tRNA reductase [Clostridiaceae bacterium 14S0207]|nr:glutamyl-tRNA reductase [Clostridiaceae bacterium 14S0207]